MKELVALVADKSMKITLETVASRYEALGIRPLRAGSEFDVFVQIHYDAGVFAAGHEFLRSQARRYHYALLMCDRHGCGHELRPRTQLEAQMEQRLADSGWRGRSAAIVIDPELEIWVWADSPHVDRAVGWGDRRPALREWMTAQGYLAPGASKPASPQECLDKALRVAGKPRSSAIFREVAERVSLSRCRDAAFRKLADTLRRWFPSPTGDAVTSRSER